jgi:hypothetical protein
MMFRAVGIDTFFLSVQPHTWRTKYKGVDGGTESSK